MKTVTAVAEQLGVGTDHVYALIARGELESALGVVSTGLGARTMRCVTDESLAAFTASTEGAAA